ncbi:MAG: AAA family ATPase, partial [Methanophagales archaeon]|nr:AAA family ATPase [Methanophagales archaeon]
MRIKRIEVRNFKSFEELKIDLGKFNVIIGANASGKSNFVHIFEFLRDITSSGLDNAISMQGGVEYLRNLNIGASEPLSIKVVSDQEFRWGLETKVGLIGIKTYEVIYEFALKFNKRGPGFRIVKDELSQKCKFLKLERKEREIKEKETLGEGEILISRSNGRVKIVLNKPSKVPLKKEDIFPPFLREEKLPEHTLLLETPYFFIPPLEGIFSEISIYDFDPKLPKKATPITGKAELEEDGNNLSIILKNITENREKRRKLFNLVKDLLPFVENLDVEKFADKSLLFKLKES